MAFKNPEKQPQFADLKGILTQSKKIDNPLSQTVEILIDRLTQFQSVTVKALARQGIDISSVSGGAGGPVLPPTTGVGGTGNGYWTPLTDGDPDETDLIFAAGECIMVFVPTS